jgi:hypothetical protein
VAEFRAKAGANVSTVLAIALRFLVPTVETNEALLRRRQGVAGIEDIVKVGRVHSPPPSIALLLFDFPPWSAVASITARRLV